jgi:glycosyltransferase involved in cell wall biosynthesis
VDALLADGHTVIILAPKDDAVPQLEALGCSFHHLEMNIKGLNPFQEPKTLIRLHRHFRNLQPDIILSFTIKNNIFGAFAAKFAGIPFIPNVTGLGTAFLSGGLLERVAVMLYKTAFRNLPVIFFQNEDDRDLFVGRDLVTERQARCLPGSGIDLNRFAAATFPSKVGAPQFLMIARLLRDKGVLEYVDAARLVKARHPGVRFQLLGPADAENRTAINRDTVRAWEREGVIEYLGTVEDVRPMIEAAQCVVLPSYREGAPRTLIEAAATARGVIATDVPGCRAVVEDGRTGFLCKVRSGESLAAACEAFMALSLEERAALGRAGREKMEREFGQSIVVDAYRTVIRDFRTTAI